MVGKSGHLAAIAEQAATFCIALLATHVRPNAFSASCLPLGKLLSKSLCWCDMCLCQTCPAAHLLFFMPHLMQSRCYQKEWQACWGLKFLHNCSRARVGTNELKGLVGQSPPKVHGAWQSRHMLDACCLHPELHPCLQTYCVFPAFCQRNHTKHPCKHSLAGLHIMNISVRPPPIKTYLEHLRAQNFGRNSHGPDSIC